ncbi:hypothetical protein, partial [Chitinimonas sp. BJB300]|uniref:hypothetical protein n=1 Tax=Chitinimonas sp. BJB300 TaxID=1559339 RepID=UPI001E3A1623
NEIHVYHPRFSGRNTGWLHTQGWKLLNAVYPWNLESFARCFTRLQLRPERIRSYFRHPKIAYAADLGY